MVVAMLEELPSLRDPIDTLTTHGDHVVGLERINVKRWQRIRPRSGDLWRLRVLDTEATSYRVVYGYSVSSRQICVLGVVHKTEFDYDSPSDGFVQRILQDWESF